MRPALNDPTLYDMLPQGRWHPEHHRRLCAWIRRTADRSGPKVAAFDWDNTCIFNDIGDATWRYQLDHLKLLPAPKVMRARLPDTIRGITRLSNGVSLPALTQDIMSAYEPLWPHIDGDTVHTVRASEAHRDFRAKMMHFITAMERTPGLGAEISYRAQAGFLTGHAPADVTRVVQSAWQSTFAEAVGTASWQSATPGQAGHVQQSYFTHIAMFDEMLDLIRALSAADVAVYIITASCETVVSGLVSALQLPISPSRIFGMRPELNEADYPLTYRAGKARVIREHLPAAPLLVAGDADTDFEMLKDFAQTEVRLILNRNASGAIRTLYAPPSDMDKPLTLLQGRDDNRACFIPDYRSIPLGRHSPVDI